MKTSCALFVFLFFFQTPQRLTSAQEIDLSHAVILVSTTSNPTAEKTASRVLVEEVEKRTGLHWKISTTWPKQGAVIALAPGKADLNWKHHPAGRQGKDYPENRAEGYRLAVQKTKDNNHVIWIVGADRRGVLFGVGRFLRLMNWGKEKVLFPADVDISTAPAYPIRGHQLGYRATANSYDAWNAEQYEQYIRELAFFGTNCIENIPFQSGKSPLMPIARDEMNVKLSQICARYDLDYWVWTPANFDLNDKAKRAAALEKHRLLYDACPRLDAIFFPGGDPGNNHPRLVMPFLEDLAKLLLPRHPKARIWISLQGFDEEQTDYFYNYVNKNMPDWLGGLVAGPSSPPIPASRKRLPKKYKLRHYPDITHTVRCQYPVAWWDQAFALTEGRECSNPQPVYYALIHNWFAPYTDGFLSYSDGVHDDVNKIIWSARGWDPQVPVRKILQEYARVFFRPDLADIAADGILALEQNWEGSLAENGAVEATHNFWQDLANKAPELKRNWRWQLCQLRSTYDAYTRRRLIYETTLEKKANRALAAAPAKGADAAMDDALAILQRADMFPPSQHLRRQIDDICEALFRSIGLQTSVKKYHASGEERGAILDFVEYPLNNRWWLEDEFAKIRKMKTEKQKIARLQAIRTWEHPGPGSFYDDLGNVARSPHVVRGEGLNTDPEMERNPNPGYWWWDNGFSRARLSWQVTMDWPLAVAYENLDVNANYVVRMTGYGQALTKMNGQRVQPTLYGKGLGEMKEFPVPEEIVKSGHLKVTWDIPDEHRLNWRQQSRIAEIWLLKH